MDRLHIAAHAVGMGADGVNHLVGCTNFSQQFGSLDAVFLREHFKVHIVEQAAQTPKIGIKSQFLGIPAHGSLNGETVENVEGFFIVLLQKC